MNEMYAVRFVAESYPITLKEIQFYMGDDPLKAGTECGIFHLKIWEDTGQIEPGKLLFDTEATENEFEVTAASAYQAFPFNTTTPSPVINGPFRVGLMAAEKQCVTSFGNNNFPVLYVDDSITLGTNFIYGVVGPATLEWLRVEDVAGGPGGKAGDFVMQAITVGGGGQPNPTGCKSVSDCSDGNPCTQDVCDVDGKCTNPPTAGPCDDGDACTINDNCLGGVCKGGAGVDCDDANPCTTDFCNSQTQSCENQIVPGCGDEDVIGNEDTGQETQDTNTGDALTEGLRLDQITPTTGSNDQATTVTVLGAGFATGLTARIGPNSLQDVTINSDKAFTATVPSGITPGVYSLIVSVGSAQTTMTDAFEIRAAAKSSDGDSGCKTTRVGNTTILMLALFGVMVVVQRQLNRKFAKK
ncbi:MAG: IPT/TIG domain-containing protein [Myxococcales bacterium]|nr:IPT/TIG domain-containing protein [Myxococcales bacterium]